MERDGSDEAPGRKADGGAEPEWTIEDFDNFAPFDERDEESDAGTRRGQGTFELEPAAAEPSPQPRHDPERPPAGGGADDTPEPPSEPSPDDEELLEVENGDAAAEQPPAAGAPAGLPDETAGVAHSEAGSEVASDAAGDDTTETAFDAGSPATASSSEEEEDVDVPEFASFTSDEYVQTTTQEFVDLAEEMARSQDTAPEQSAISAGIPGLESGIVGLEDVVAATGTDPSAIPVAARSNLASRVFTGLGLALIFFASLYDPALVGMFVLIVLTLSAGEFYAAFMRAGHRPLALFGVLGAAGAMAGTWVWGLIAVPVAVAVTIAATLLFFGLAVERRNPTLNLALTVMGTLWVGGMGAFALDFLRAEDYGWLLVATVVTVAVMDMSSYFVGRRVGRHRLAPHVSPRKTVEGLVGGVLAAVLVGVAFSLRDPFDLGSGLALGVVVAVAAPFGDLAVSVMKRSIGVKDMGTLLPGHGGLLDRLDAMLFAIPLAWIVFSWNGLIP